MGCQTECDIGDNLTWTVTTHDPTTGALTDADAVPAYRVYEDETGATLMTGNMAKLDDAGTTGFYSEQIAVTAANGFEDGKSYNIYITAAVGGTTGGISYAFKAVAVASKAAGAVEFTYTVTDAATGLPIEGVEVWISTDAAGANVIWHGHTDAFGVARDDSDNLPWLEPGNAYFWSQLGGYTFSNPDLEVVS
jgi:hypothetical protein